MVKNYIFFYKENIFNFYLIFKNYQNNALLNSECLLSSLFVSER